jgi:hypothetical protein
MKDIILCLSFPLVGNLSFNPTKKDAGQAGMTIRFYSKFRIPAPEFLLYIGQQSTLHI